MQAFWFGECRRSKRGEHSV